VNKILLVPSARLVAHELQTEFGRLPTCMIPLGGVPVLRLIAEPYLAQGFQVLVAVDERADLVESYLAHGLPGRVGLVRVGPTRSLGQTILASLYSLPEQPGQLVINFGDTYLDHALPEGDRFSACAQPDLYRWTTFCPGGPAGIGEIWEKHTDKPDTAGQLVFTGVFSFTRADRLLRLLAEEEARPGGAGLQLDSFYRAIQRYYAEVADPAAVCGGWIDLGHLDTYYSARQEQFLGTRAFNSVQVDKERGLLTKRSRNVAKLRGEIRWYLDLPPQLAHVAPRIFAADVTSPEPWVTMELYGYPPLSDLFLFGQLDPGDWRGILQVLRRVLADFRGHPLAAPADQRRACQKEMYLEKTLQRVRQIPAGGAFEPYRHGDFTINGRPCLNLAAAMELLPGVLEREGLLEPEPFSVIHGDFCLSNILYDRRSRIARLVDPRGEFGALGIHGDPRYDLAKLSHSVNGGYDFIVSDLFTLAWDGPDLRLALLDADRHAGIRRLFREVFFPEDSPTETRRWRQVRLIESLLFLSMVPLHDDRPAAQEAFLARGLDLFSRIQSLEET